MSRLVSLLWRRLARSLANDFIGLNKHEAVVDGKVYSSSTALYWYEVRSQCAYAHLASVVALTFLPSCRRLSFPN
jgi:hypothetical protein